MYQQKLLQYDLALKNEFSENNYNYSNNDLIAIKKEYEESITYIDANKLKHKDDMYLLLKQADETMIKTNDVKIQNLLGVECTNLIYSCESKVNMLEIIELVQTKNIVDVLKTKSYYYYISLNDFYLRKNVNSIKDIEYFSKRKIRVTDSKYDDPIFKQYKDVIANIGETYQFQIDNLRIYGIAKINPSKIKPLLSSSIVINTNKLNDLLNDYKNFEYASSDTINSIYNKLNKIENLTRNDSDQYFVSFSSKDDDSDDIKTLKNLYKKIDFILPSLCNSINIQDIYPGNVLIYEDPFSTNMFILETGRNTSRNDKYIEQPLVQEENEYKFLVSAEILQTILTDLNNLKTADNKIQQKIKELNELNDKYSNAKVTLYVLEPLFFASSESYVGLETSVNVYAYDFPDSSQIFPLRQMLFTTITINHFAFPNYNYNYYIPLSSLCNKTEIFSKQNFLRNISSICDKVTTNNLTKIDNRNGWFFKNDKLSTKNNEEYVFLPEDIVDTIIANKDKITNDIIDISSP